MENYQNHPGPEVSHSPSEEHFTDHSHSPSHTPPSPDMSEHFTNLNGDLDKVLKAVFFGAIFYLLSQPELYKMTKKVVGKIDGVLLHSIVFAVVYFVLNMFI